MLLCRDDSDAAPSACIHRERRPAPWHDQRCLAKPASRPGWRRRCWRAAWLRPHARLRERPGGFRRL